jgi:hypothetical protein
MNLSNRVVLIGSLFSLTAFSNPYPDPGAVPWDPPYVYQEVSHLPVLSSKKLRMAAEEVLRVDISWASGEKYKVEQAIVESSGTEALLKRSQRLDSLGSYKAQILDLDSGKTLAHDSLGTGQHYRHLVRALTFRFPNPNRPVQLLVTAENPTSGFMEVVLKEKIEGANRAEEPAREPEVRLIKAATEEPKLKLNLYAEGYKERRRERFFQDAKRLSDTLKSENLPGLSHFEISGVFMPSALELGSAKKLGFPIPERNSFLGLYFPYWDTSIERWFNIVYPTRERRYRDGVALVPYDYPLAIIDDSGYWGVGNFNEITAIPNDNFAYTYLLMHELGHFFGLNEEYEEGGPTELAFAPGVKEPWSQNITFLEDPKSLKWKQLISLSTPVPTPSSKWKGSGPFGAYKGGYAQTKPFGRSHKPGLNCRMAAGTDYCPICQSAIEEKVFFDLGL